MQANIVRCLAITALGIGMLLVVGCGAGTPDEPKDANAAIARTAGNIDTSLTGDSRDGKTGLTGNETIQPIDCALIQFENLQGEPRNTTGGISEDCVNHDHNGAGGDSSDGGSIGGDFNNSDRVRVIVGIEKGIQESAARSLVRAYGLRIDELVTEELWQYGMIVGELDQFDDSVDHPMVTDYPSTVRYVAADPNMTPAQAEPERDVLVGPVQVFSDWAVRFIRAPEVRNAPERVTGRGVRVCVVDSGVERHNSLLGPDRVPEGKSFNPDRVILVGTTVRTVPDNPFRDSSSRPGGHGTGVASLIAAGSIEGFDRYYGVAPNATIVSVKVSNQKGTTVSRVLAGISWAAESKKGNCRVVNVSLSWGYREDYDAIVREDAGKILAKAATTAIIVAAAGNKNEKEPRWPAYSYSVISVGGTAYVNKNTRWTDADGSSGSNYGVLDRDGRGELWVNVSAPAHWVLMFSSSRRSVFKIANGTSFSAPLVSGTVALLLEKGRYTTLAEVRDRLQRTGIEEPELLPGGESRWHGPRIDAYRAVFDP